MILDNSNFQKIQKFLEILEILEKLNNLRLNLIDQSNDQDHEIAPIKINNSCNFIKFKNS